MSQKLVVMWSVSNINKYLIDREIIVGCDDNFCRDNWIDMLDVSTCSSPRYQLLVQIQNTEIVAWDDPAHEEGCDSQVHTHHHCCPCQTHFQEPSNVFVGSYQD